ncbi:hypothetical protein BC939DRAFT_450580 [Gamsiella multidivaricata]|uniref:uncharacterized protein n=1 Tax=Gamsiella multidivaricata TaxID=101098 RepID=UPI00221FE8D6|nr:uncharacterized protein BC939DRAFT_450580 [Gamsiella multidivaricata]KAI7824105.1 hypothetical protein BC939DRAFT_450580 [Gamsiella multidivaricata]
MSTLDITEQPDLSKRPATPNGKPHVLIVGAGLAGLMLALLLEKADIPYQIFERAAKIRPLGSALSLGANILPVFEQLGLLEEIERISLPVYEQKLYDGNMKNIGSMTMREYKEFTGYDTFIFARPRLYEVMFDRVPAEKVFMNRKVLALEQNHLGVMIRCNDGSQYHGDILIGADGAYSSVRQALYKKMLAKNVLPKSDNESLAPSFVTTVGVTDPVDPEKYPALRESTVNFSQVIGGQLMSWGTLTIPDNRICWGASLQLTSETESKEQQFRNSEWGPESIESSLALFRDCRVPIGGTLGDLMDATPKDLISKVYLEEKLFETWHYGRTALAGDACHKMLLSAGQGAVNAMQDAVVLANVIYDLESTTQEAIEAAFLDYRTQRYPHAKYQYINSKLVSKLMTGQVKRYFLS